MAVVKDFLNALVLVRDKHETVTVGWHTFSFGENHGMPGCKITVRRPVTGDFLEPTEAIGHSGFAFPSNSIVTKAPIFAHTDNEYDRLRRQHECGHLSDQLDAVDRHIDELQRETGSKEHMKGVRENINRLEGVRDELLAKLELTVPPKILEGA